MKNPYLTRRANEILRSNNHTPGPRQDTATGFTVSCVDCDASVSVEPKGDSTAYTPQGTHIKCRRTRARMAKIQP